MAALPPRLWGESTRFATGCFKPARNQACVVFLQSQGMLFLPVEARKRSGPRGEQRVMSKLRPFCCGTSFMRRRVRPARLSGRRGRHPDQSELPRLLSVPCSRDIPGYTEDPGHHIHERRQRGSGRGNSTSSRARNLYSVTVADFTNGGPAIDDKYRRECGDRHPPARQGSRISFPEDYSPGIPGRQLNVFDPDGRQHRVLALYGRSPALYRRVPRYTRRFSPPFSSSNRCFSS